MNVLHYLLEAEEALGKSTSQLKPTIEKIQVEANQDAH